MDYVNKKFPVTPSRIEPVTFQLVVQCLEYLSINASHKSPHHPYFSTFLPLPPSQLQTPPSTTSCPTLSIYVLRKASNHILGQVRALVLVTSVTWCTYCHLA